MIKRFIVFAGDDYYPRGLADYKSEFDSLEEALSFARECVDEHGSDFAEILDRESRQIHFCEYEWKRKPEGGGERVWEVEAGELTKFESGQYTRKKTIDACH